MNKIRLALIIGPTAVGKSSIIDRALAEFPQLSDIVTYTTRTPRDGESEGQPYHFVTQEKFLELEARGFFLETAQVHGRSYGTPRDQVEAAARENKCVIVDIDVQGAKKIMGQFPEAISIFLLPPSLSALEERFIKRGVTDPEDLRRRLESARVEIAQAGDFHHQILNENLEAAYAQVCEILHALY